MIGTRRITRRSFLAAAGLAAVGASLSLTGCSGSVSDGLSSKHLLVAHSHSEAHPVNVGLQKMTEVASAESDLTFSVYPNGQLGDNAAMIQLVKAGVLDIAKVSASSMEQFNSAYAIFSITTGMFAVAPGFFVNFLFFIQGIGTSGSQSIIGNWATDISSWHTVAWGLLAIGAVAMVLFVLFPMPEVQEHKTEGKGSPKEIMSCPAFLSLVLIIGLYFIAEHGIMNWLVSYATNALEVPMGQAANFTAVFFGCVMVGRLVLSSLVDKLGVYRCLRLFATSAAVLYTAGVLLGAPGLWLLAVSGLLFSILYPTLVMLIPRYWPSHAASSASGLVLSVASLADILFNAVFGSLVDAIGYRTSFLIMPACMVGCTALLWLFFAKAKKLERCD